MWRTRENGVAATFVLSLLLTAAGCETTPKAKDDPPPVAKPENRLNYDALRASYNRRTQRIEQMWVRAVVEVRWKEGGKQHFEQGDGPLIVRKPSEMALSIGKLGNTMIWLGGDAERYWLFNLNPPKGEPTAAFVGRHDDLGMPGAKSLPIPIKPSQITELRGVADLPPSGAAGKPSAQKTDGGVVVTVTDPGRPGYVQRLIIDPTSYEPTQITHSMNGQIVLEARLSNYKSLSIEGKAIGDWPSVPGRIEIHAPQDDATLTLFLSNPSEGGDRVRDTQFDFDRLVRALKPEKVHKIRPR